jgi:ferredoxin, 2Fe-2S
MARIAFIQPDGSARVVEAVAGETLMIAATTAGVEGVIAECGGSCMCATCHSLVLEGPVNALLAMEENERDTLEFTAAQMWETCRLTCQISMTEARSGLTPSVVEW